MDQFRLKVKEEVLSAKRGPFGGWWEDLLEVDPELLVKVHRHMVAAERGPLSKSFRHLIFATVDSVVTHLYPRGIGVHARTAMEHGATLRHVVEALEISAVVSNRGYSVVLPLVVEELEKSGYSVVAADEAHSSEIRRRYESRVGEWQGWMDVALDYCPDALEALLELGYGRSGRDRREEGDGLDLKQRALLFLAASGCPALADVEAVRSHTRQALKLGASPEEIMQTVKVANVIGLHPIVEGIPQLRTVLSAR